MNDTIIIDADAHVEEDEDTWAYLDPEFADRRPIPVVLDDPKYDAIYGDINAHWLIDGHPTNSPVGPGAMLSLTPPRSRAAINKPFPVGSQSLADIDARLADMDKIGVRTQVLFPTAVNHRAGNDGACARQFLPGMAVWRVARRPKYPGFSHLSGAAGGGTILAWKCSGIPLGKER